MTVVPFDQVGINFSHGSKASQFAGASCALQGTDKHPGECQPCQSFPEPPSRPLTVFGERQVGESGVLAGQTPRSFPVASKVDDRKALTHYLVSSINLVLACGCRPSPKVAAPPFRSSGR